MTKLMDIRGGFGLSGVENGEKYYWQGKLLLEEDGWFEGIVNNSSSDFGGNRMIFGVFVPYKGIELVKISPDYVSLPFIYRDTTFTSQNNIFPSYHGEFAKLNTTGEEILGDSTLIIQDVEYLIKQGCADHLINTSSRRTHGITGFEYERISQQLNEFKTNEFKNQNNFQELYDEIHSRKEEILARITRSYEEQPQVKKLVKKSKK